MFAVVYRWRLHEGREEQFVEAWSQLTTSIRGQCGSFGSRLHRDSDGNWIAYAVWPDEATWRACSPDAPAAGEAMAAAVAESHDPMPLTVVTDLLTGPTGPSGPVGPID